MPGREEDRRRRARTATRKTRRGCSIFTKRGERTSAGLHSRTSMVSIVLRKGERRLEKFCSWRKEGQGPAEQRGVATTNNTKTQRTEKALRLRTKGVYSHGDYHVKYNRSGVNTGKKKPSCQVEGGARKTKLGLNVRKETTTSHRLERRIDTNLNHATLRKEGKGKN